MKDNLRITRSMVKEERHLVMVKCMKETIYTVKELEWESSTGVMAHATMANLKTILSKERVNANRKVKDAEPGKASLKVKIRLNDHGSLCV